MFIHVKYQYIGPQNISELVSAYKDKQAQQKAGRKDQTKSEVPKAPKKSLPGQKLAKSTTTAMYSVRMTFLEQ